MCVIICRFSCCLKPECLKLTFALLVSSAGWPVDISWSKCCLSVRVCVCVCMDVNQGDTSRNRCAQRLVVLLAQWMKYYSEIKWMIKIWMLHKSALFQQLLNEVINDRWTSECTVATCDIDVLDLDLERSQQTPDMGYHVDERRRRTSADAFWSSWWKSPRWFLCQVRSTAELFGGRKIPCMRLWTLRCTWTSSGGCIWCVDPLG